MLLHIIFGNIIIANSILGNISISSCNVVHACTSVWTSGNYLLYKGEKVGWVHDLVNNNEYSHIHLPLISCSTKVLKSTTHTIAAKFPQVFS